MTYIYNSTVQYFTTPKSVIYSMLGNEPFPFKKRPEKS